ncbi:MAG: hypothetical protein ACXAD7_05425 [Candidatus Kariarchaeaceae archaeon]|jgi:hypothetical protein
MTGESLRVTGQPIRPKSITYLGIILIIISVFAFVGSFFIWGEGIIVDPPADTDLSYPITDILINSPSSMIAGIGLLRMKKWGKYMGWFVAGFYIYASIEIFVDVAQEGGFPLEIVLPQIVAIGVAILVMKETLRFETLFE